MKKALTFLWENYISTILLVNLVLGVLVFWTNYLMPQQHFFAVYLMMYPLFPVAFLLIYGYNLSALWQNMALSFQCRRHDYFWAGQVAFLATGVGCALITVVMGVLYVNVLDLSSMAAGSPFLENGIPWAKPGAIPAMAVLALCFQPIGAALGSLYEKHKILTTVILCAMMLLGIAGTSMSLFMAEWGIAIAGPVLVGVCALFVVLALVGEAAYYRSIRKAVVR